METPSVPINFVPAKEGEVINLGMVSMRIMESGARTNNRIGTAEFTLPPHTSGPPAHWHEMHDETFLVTQGKMQFHGLHGETIVAGLGDYVTVPTRSPHTFTNPYDEEAKFFCTMTPANYIQYFKMLSQVATKGVPMKPEDNIRMMAYFATIGVAEEDMKPAGVPDEKPEKGEQVEHGTR